MLIAFNELLTKKCPKIEHQRHQIFVFILIWAYPGLFSSFFSFQNQLKLQYQRYKWAKIIDGVLGIRTKGRSMVGADETTEKMAPA